MNLVKFRRAAWLALAGAIVLGVALYPRGEPWRPLPGGGEIKLLRLAYEETSKVREPGIAFYPLRQWLGPKWERLLGPQPMETSVGWGAPTFAASFLCRGRDGKLGLEFASCEIDLPGGQTLRSGFHNSGSLDGQTFEPAAFEIAPFSEKRLHLRVEVRGETLHYNVRNPAYVRKRAAWKAAPLPQTHTVEGVEITLHRVIPVETHEWAAGSPWAARAEFSARMKGKDVSTWMRWNPTFCDPVGNESLYTAIFSEPVWKVRCRAVQTDYFPFADSEVNWLGRVTLPGPNEARLIALTPATRDARLHLLALVGPGHYHAVPGKITAIPPPPPELAAEGAIRHYYSGRPASIGDGENTEIDSDALQLLSIASTGLAGEQEGGPPLIFMRDDAGRRILLKMTHGLGATSLLALPKLTPGTREVEIGLREVRELKTEFLVRPPPPPNPATKAAPSR